MRVSINAAHSHTHVIPSAAVTVPVMWQPAIALQNCIKT